MKAGIVGIDLATLSAVLGIKDAAVEDMEIIRRVNIVGAGPLLLLKIVGENDALKKVEQGEMLPSIRLEVQVFQDEDREGERRVVKLERNG